MKRAYLFMAFMLTGIIALTSCSSDDKSDEPGEPGGDPTTELNSIEKILVGIWRDSEFETYTFRADKTGEINYRSSSYAEQGKFKWSVNADERLIIEFTSQYQLKEPGEQEVMPLSAISSDYIIYYYSGSDNVMIRTGKPSYPVNVVDADNMLLGSWEGYEDKGETWLDLNLRADGSATMEVYDKTQDNCLAVDDYVWSLNSSSNNIHVYFVNTSTFEVDEDIYEICGFNQTALILRRSGSDEIYSFLKKGTATKMTNEFILGQWVANYFIDEDMSKDYDLIEVNANGKGVYTEHAYSFRPETFSFDWSLNQSTQILTITYPNGEYGYKPDEPEYETDRYRMKLCNKDVCFCVDEEGDVMTLVREGIINL